MRLTTGSGFGLDWSSAERGGGSGHHLGAERALMESNPRPTTGGMHSSTPRPTVTDYASPTDSTREPIPRSSRVRIRSVLFESVRRHQQVVRIRPSGRPIGH